jgi:hypothetical protein
MKPEAVDAELQSVRSSIGSSEDVSEFLRRVLQAANVPYRAIGKSISIAVSDGVPRALRQAIGRDEPFSGRFELPLQEGDVYLGRTSPVIEGLSAWTLDQALDPVAREAQPVASRCGVIATSAVKARTTLLITRFRHHLRLASASEEAILCEEILALACRGSADAPQWLSPEESEQLLTAEPERNLVATAIEQQLGLLLAALPELQVSLETIAEQRASAQLAAHDRVRVALHAKGRVTVAPVLPVDILAAYLMLPKLG